MTAAPPNPSAPADQGLADSERTSPEARSLHWEQVYTSREANSVSWYEPVPERSLELIDRVRLEPDAHIIDVGGGASRLVDELIARGHRSVTVIDTSSTALEVTRNRLGTTPHAALLVADVLASPSLPSAELWHDRAVFHFLVDDSERDRYRSVLAATLSPGGHVAVATFSDRGPERCSGLPVRRYSSEGLAAEFPWLETVATGTHTHVTPAGALQEFTYLLMRDQGAPRTPTAGGTHE